MPRWVVYFLFLSLLAPPALAGPPPRVDVYLTQGRDHQAAGRIDLAIEAYRRAILLDPRHPQAYTRLREAYGKRMEVEELIRVLQEAKAQDEQDFISRNLLGVLYARKRLWKEAVGELREALRIQPQDVDARVNLGWVLSELKRYEDARREFLEALRLNPGYARAHAGLGGILVEADRDYKAAVAEYRKALELEPKNVTYLNDLAWTYYRAGQLDEAREAFQQAIQIEPENLVGQTNLGWVYLKEGDLERAAAQFRQALAIDPNYAFAHFGLGKALDALGEGREAIDEYKKAWRLSKNDLYLLYLAGLYFRWNLWAFLLIGLGATLTVAYIAIRAFRKGL